MARQRRAGPQLIIVPFVLIMAFFIGTHGIEIIKAAGSAVPNPITGGIHRLDPEPSSSHPGGGAASPRACNTIIKNGPGNRLPPIPQNERRQLIDEALRLAGKPVTQTNEDDVALIVADESSWVPDSENDWDSNFRAGHPSRGLMQIIPATFKEHMVRSPCHNNIDNPVDNMAAGIRYAYSRYGSLELVPGVVAVHRGLPYVPY